MNQWMLFAIKPTLVCPLVLEQLKTAAYSSSSLILTQSEESFQTNSPNYISSDFMRQVPLPCRYVLEAIVPHTIVMLYNVAIFVTCPWNEATFYMASKVFHMWELSKLMANLPILWWKLILCLKFTTNLIFYNNCHGRDNQLTGSCEIRVLNRPSILVIIQHAQGSCPTFHNKENLSWQGWTPLVQLTHGTGIITTIFLYNKWHYITS